MNTPQIDELPAAMSHQQWAKLFASASRSLDHLELRDCYSVDYEDERYRQWVAAERPSRLPREEHPWWELTALTIKRGVAIRRARVISEPVSEYIAFEYAGTWQNVEFGERVRWLSRRRASSIALPGNDFWLLDGERVLFNVFDGDGHPVARQLTGDAAVVDLCRSAFEHVWASGIDHGNCPLRSADLFHT